ncbi:MAG: SAVED domain-containing protein, partial [Gemmatimonadota bacterium]
ADVTVRFANGDQAVTRVRSELQLQAIREAFREALAGIKNFRPNAEMLHLFVAAPNSVCFVIGQELVPRNTPPVQTYVYRPGAASTAYQPAILITAGPAETRGLTLSDSDIELATKLRTSVWSKAIRQVREYAQRKRAERGSETGGHWYAGLQPSDELQRVAPFPSLPAIYDLVKHNDDVDVERFYEDYGYDAERRLWRLGDSLVVGMYKAAGEDESKLEPLVRLFLFHEYVHQHHSLTKYTAANVGKFANALERLDYTADTFAIFHEIDFQHYLQLASGASPPDVKQSLAAQVEQILLSFWAFDGPPPHVEMQVRRVRRYLNWYWRLAQIRRAESPLDAVALFGRSPAVELAGVPLRTDGERRVYHLLQETPAMRPEVALVLENEKLVRLTESDSTSLAHLIQSFRNGDHAALAAWFRPVFELAKDVGDVYPALHPMVARHSHS